MTIEYGSVERALGRVEGKLDSLMKQFAGYVERNDAASAEVRERMSALKGELDSVRADIATTETVVASLKPFVADFSKLKQRSVGIISVLVLAWAIFNSAIADAFHAVMRLVSKALSVS